MLSLILFASWPRWHSRVISSGAYLGSRNSHAYPRAWSPTPSNLIEIPLDARRFISLPRIQLMLPTSSLIACCHCLRLEDLVFSC